MAVKDEVLKTLEENKGFFISGGELAAALGVSRNAVWKAVGALGSAGYTIESVTGKGYRLASDCSILSAESIKRYLRNDALRVEFHESIDSTNNRAKAAGASGEAGGLLVVADEQTAGRGRQGRPFFSPAGTGIYFSLMMRPSWPLADMAYVTSYSAVCVARALEEVFGADAHIKWVNDVFVGGHKVCGILTEAAVLPEAGGIDYVVVGIGINVAEPKGGFPPEFAGVARALRPSQADAEDARARLVACVADYFMEDFERIPARPHLSEYRKRSLLDGCDVHVETGSESFEATVLGINDDLTLQVRLADDSERALVAGEVHIPSTQLTTSGD